jgi:hypothetical protein
LHVPEENSTSDADEPEAQGDSDVSAISSSVEDYEVEAVNYYPENGMQVDGGFVSSKGLMGIKYTTKTKEIIDPALRKTNKDLRRATNIEKEMWNRKLLSMWRNEIEEKNHLLNVPRAAFMLRKKLKYGVKNCFDKIAQTFKVASDYSKDKEEFETTFAYMEYTMRKYINDTIGAKHEEMKQNHKRNDGPGPLKLKCY